MKLILFSLLCISALLPIELEKRRVLNNKIEILIPKGFKEMSPEMLNFKYKGQNKPTLVFSDEDGEVNIAFNHLPNKANNEVIENYKNSVKTSFQTSFPKATWKADGVKEINGRKVGYLKLITDAIDQKVYNSLFITHCEGKLLVGTFNCTEKQMAEWEKISEEIIQSIKIK